MRISKSAIGIASLLFVLGLSVVGFLQPTALNAGHRAERPFRIMATGIETGSLIPGAVDTELWGEGTHIGKFQGGGSGFVNWSTGEAFGTGVLTAANGDQIYFENTLTNGESVMTFTGGTGRFKGATGAIVPIPDSTPVITIDVQTMTFTIKGSYTAVGTIAY